MFAFAYGSSKAIGTCPTFVSSLLATIEPAVGFPAPSTSATTALA